MLVIVRSVALARHYRHFMFVLVILCICHILDLLLILILAFLQLFVCTKLNSCIALK